MNILITGGAGYLGYSLIGALASTGAGIGRIVIYDNLTRSNHAVFSGNQCNGLNVSFVQADILDNRTLDAGLKDIDVVIHLAARVDTPNSDAEAHSFDQINNWGSAQVVRAIEDAGSVSRVIFLSSTAVYGESDEPVTEDSPLRPSSIYGISKLRAERHFTRLAEKLPVCTIRSGNVYGYNRSTNYNSVINRMVFDARFQSRIFIEGSGKQSRAFIHIDKLAAAIAQMALGDNFRAGIHNFAEHNFSIIDIVDQLVEAFPTLEYVTVDQDMRMRSFSVELPVTLSHLLPAGEIPFRTEIEDFVRHLSI